MGGQRARARAPRRQAGKCARGPFPGATGSSRSQTLAPPEEGDSSLRAAGPPSPTAAASAPSARWGGTCSGIAPRPERPRPLRPAKALRAGAHLRARPCPRGARGRATSRRLAGAPAAHPAPGRPPRASATDLASF